MFSKAHWRLGLRGKFAALVFLSGAIIAAGVAGLLNHLASNVVEEHELADLQDEAELRCWEIIDLVGQLRRTVNRATRSVKDSEEFQPLVDKLKKLAAAPPKSVAASQLAGWEPYIIALDRFQGDKITRIYRAPALAGLPPEAVKPPTQLIAEAAVRSARQNYVKLGRIEPLTVPWGFVPVLAPGKSDSAAGETMDIPTIWCASQDKEAPKDGAITGLAVCVSLYRGHSARHLQFLTDEDVYLQYPKTEGGKVKPLYLHETRDEPIDLLHFNSQEMKWAKANDGRVADFALAHQTQRREGAPQKARLASPLYFREGAVEGGAWKAILKEESYSSWKEELRTTLERKGIVLNVEDSGLLRVRARSAEACASGLREVEEAFKVFNQSAHLILWNQSDVVLKTADYQRMRFSLVFPQTAEAGAPPKAAADPENGPWYYLVYGAFHEELASAISEDLRKVGFVGILAAALAALLASSLAVLFVRPLSLIARTAQNVAISDSTGETFERQINSVLQQVNQHLGRRDEVGDIAAALEKLLREVLHGHDGLRQARRDLVEKVAEQTKELVEKAQRLESLDVAKNELIQLITHNLRTPLTVIKGNLDWVMEQNKLDEDQQSALSDASASAVHLNRLISEILGYHRLREKQVNLAPREIEPEPYFREIYNSFRNPARNAGTELEFEGVDALGPIVNDPLALRQVLENLIGNALKFTKNGLIRLSGIREIDAAGCAWMKIAVSDNGPGIDPKILPALFKPFNTLPEAQGNKDGSGLGLATSRKYVELMGGTLDLALQEGPGATFVMRIPANIEPFLSGTPPSAPSASGPGALERPVVLVVDDDPAILVFMQSFLQPKGYEVIGAQDGETGFRLALERQPAAVILDVVLPFGQSGWEIIARLKGDPATAALPVMMLSFLEDEGLGEMHGAEDYVKKPIARDALLASLRKITGFSTARSAPVLIVDDDPRIRHLFAQTLAAEGLSFVEASNGAEALQKLEEIRPAVILLDLGMPVMNGDEFIAQFEKEPKWRGIPIIVVTGSSLTTEEREKIAGSVTAIVRKDERIREEILSNVLGAFHERSARHPRPPTP